MKENGRDRSRWNRLDPRTKIRREPRRIGNPPLSFREVQITAHRLLGLLRQEEKNPAHDHRHCKVYEEDKKTYFAAHPDRKPKEQRSADWKARAETVEKAKERAKGKVEEKAMVEDPAQTEV